MAARCMRPSFSVLALGSSLNCPFEFLLVTVVNCTGVFHAFGYTVTDSLSLQQSMCVKM